MLAERGHCTKALLQRLNPGVDLTNLSPGDSVVLPNVASSTSIFTKLPKAAAIEVHLGCKTVTPLDDSGRPVAQFNCSIAKFVEKRPRGETVVRVVALEPNYTFDPKMWPEERNETRKLQIKPGPRNPVGLAWVGLALPGYGIHGTPNPEMIGKTGSHGCIRLTNWDAIRLARMVKVGTPVRFVE
ncbi:MAG: L,D-transpeptidase [Planctomycetota bacterium]|nr:L,D-transpeptidase [Planctomycetota bacterium]